GTAGSRGVPNDGRPMGSRDRSTDIPKFRGRVFRVGDPEGPQRGRRAVASLGPRTLGAGLHPSNPPKREVHWQLGLEQDAVPPRSPNGAPAEVYEARGRLGCE